MAPALPRQTFSCWGQEKLKQKASDMQISPTEAQQNPRTMPFLNFKDKTWEVSWEGNAAGRRNAEQFNGEYMEKVASACTR